MQLQISWLLQKPTDLDLHCLQRQGTSEFSRRRVKIRLQQETRNLCEEWSIKAVWDLSVLWLTTTADVKTSKFHGEFMSPALFLFEVLKMVKLTRGPLVLYQLPKYWSRKPVIKNNFKILKKPHVYLQIILKAPVKFQRIGLKLW